MDLKQLKFFVVSADVSSFSESAKILFTTQSNVSKAIMALEESLGIKLFYREARGISLTLQGKNVYRQAKKILEEVSELENMAPSVEAEWLNISTNPSSWFARQFVDFYNTYYDEKLHIRIQSTSTGEIMNRVRDCKDEIGFLYVFQSQQEAFQYKLECHALEFTELSRVNGMLYLGKKHPAFDKRQLSQKEIDQLRYIQIYQDEFTGHGTWSLKGDEERKLSDMDVSVITNSDYIMEMMLTNSRLANISGTYLAKKKEAFVKKGISLECDDGQIIYGYVKRKDEKIDKAALMLIDYLKAALAQT